MALPISAPMPAVTAIASAPQKPTLIAGFIRGAPPARAPSAPSATRKTIAAAGTALTMAFGGARNAVSVGSAAPSENATADAKAAWIGLGSAPSLKDALVTRMRGERVLGHELIGHLTREPRLHATIFVDVSELACFFRRLLAERAPLAH